MVILVVHILLAVGADVRAQNEYDLTVLHLASHVAIGPVGRAAVREHCRRPELCIPKYCTSDPRSNQRSGSTGAERPSATHPTCSFFFPVLHSLSYIAYSTTGARQLRTNTVPSRLHSHLLLPRASFILSFGLLDIDDQHWPQLRGASTLLEYSP